MRALLVSRLEGEFEGQASVQNSKGQMLGLEQTGQRERFCF